MALRIKPDNYVPPVEDNDEIEAEEIPVEEPIEESPAAQPAVMHGSGSVPQDVARYLPPDAICQNCIYFMEPGTCEIVAGAIEPQGRCSLFVPDQMQEESLDPSMGEIPAEPVTEDSTEEY